MGLIHASSDRPPQILPLSQPSDFQRRIQNHHISAFALQDISLCRHDPFR